MNQKLTQSLRDLEHCISVLKTDSLARNWAMSQQPIHSPGIGFNEPVYVMIHDPPPSNVNAKIQFFSE